MGRVQARDGRGPWVLEDEAHARAVIAATRAQVGPQDMMIDYDHQAVFAIGEGKGGKAEAAGWVALDTLEVRPDGIWGVASWTSAAAAKLSDRAYRYVSPYFFSEKATGRVTRISNAALVNQPALRELGAAASASLNPGNPESMKTLLPALGLKDDAVEADALAAITKLQADLAAATGQIAATAQALGLKVGATGEEVAAAAATAATAGEPDPAKYIPIEAHTAALAPFKVLLEERNVAAVEQAIASGRLVPAQRDWALGYVEKDAAGFAAFVQAQPVILNGKAGSAAGKVETDPAVLSDEDRQACAAIGVTEADFIAARKLEAAQ